MFCAFYICHLNASVKSIGTVVLLTGWFACKIQLTGRDALNFLLCGGGGWQKHIE